MTILAEEHINSRVKDHGMNHASTEADQELPITIDMHCKWGSMEHGINKGSADGECGVPIVAEKSQNRRN